MPPGTIIVGEGGSTGGPFLSAEIDLTEPGSFFRSRGGGLGFGLPAPLGVKLARPDHPVVGLIGEGDGMYTNQALWTAAHYRIPVTYVVLNNGSYRILKQNMLTYLKNLNRAPVPAPSWAWMLTILPWTMPGWRRYGTSLAGGSIVQGILGRPWWMLSTSRMALRW